MFKGVTSASTKFYNRGWSFVAGYLAGDADKDSKIHESIEENAEFFSIHLGTPIVHVFRMKVKRSCQSWSGPPGLVELKEDSLLPLE